MSLNDMYVENYVGNTPLVKLKRMVSSSDGNVFLKLEGNNPAGSVKDRPALSMIKRAQEKGKIKPGDTLIEATSGNTGIALAMASAVMGYKMILVMPENQSVERRQTMQAYGAKLVLTSQEGSWLEILLKKCKVKARELFLISLLILTTLWHIMREQGQKYGMQLRKKSPTLFPVWELQGRLLGPLDI